MLSVAWQEPAFLSGPENLLLRCSSKIKHKMWHKVWIVDSHSCLCNLWLLGFCEKTSGHGFSSGPFKHKLWSLLSPWSVVMVTSVQLCAVKHNFLSNGQKTKETISVRADFSTGLRRQMFLKLLFLWKMTHQHISINNALWQIRWGSDKSPMKVIFVL